MAWGGRVSEELSFPPAVLFRWFAGGVVLVAAVRGLAAWPAAWPAVAAIAALACAWKLPVLRRQFTAVAGLMLMLLRVSFLPAPLQAGSFTGAQTFTAVIAEAPRISEKAVRYVVEAKVPAGARVLLTARPLPGFNYGDAVRVDCQEIAAVSFDGYRRQGIERECAFPELALVRTAAPSLRGRLLSLRREAGRRLQGLVAEPYVTLATGMLWGDDGGLPREITDDFRRTGTTHLLAVSGYNVMVFTGILFWLLIGAGLWRRSATFAVLMVLPLFVVFTGAEPAVVRAAIMAALVAVGRLGSRAADRANLLLGTAAVMLMFQPALAANLGFQLSFAAMAGLLCLAPRLATRLGFVPERWGLREAAAQTLAATLATLPVIWLGVGTVSVVSPFANLLIAPTVALVYGAGLSALALSFVPYAEFLSAAVGWALTLILSYILFVARALAALPWAAAGAVTWWACLLALAGGGAWWRLYKRRPV